MRGHAIIKREELHYRAISLDRRFAWRSRECRRAARGKASLERPSHQPALDSLSATRRSMTSGTRRAATLSDAECLETTPSESPASFSGTIRPVSLAQFIMFRLSFHLAREIEWRFSFGDTGPGNNDGDLSHPPAQTPSHPRLPLPRHCPARIIVLATARSLRAVLPPRVPVIRTLVTRLHFFRSRYAIRLPHRSWIRNCTHVYVRACMCLCARTHRIYSGMTNAPRTHGRVLIRRRDDSERGIN